MKKILALLLSATMACSLLAACTAAPAASGTSSAAGSAKGENVELRFSWWGSEARHEATLAAIEVYEAANPGVKIVPEYSGYEGYQDKLMAQIAGGNAPDIFTCVVEWIPNLSEVNGALDLTGKFDMTGHSESTIKASTYNDQVLGVNVSLNGYAVYANKTLADQYGVKLPEGDYTWDDLAALWKEATEKSAGAVQGIMDIRYAGWIMEAFGYTYLSKPWPYMWDNEKLTVTAEDITAFFDYVAKIPEGVMLSADESANVDVFTASPVAQGLTMFEFGSTGTYAPVQSQTEDEIVLLPLPVGSKGETANASRPGLLLSIFQGTKHSEEAAKFLDWFTNSPEAVKSLKTTRGVPPTTTQREALLKEEGLLERSDMVVIDCVDKIFSSDVNVFLPGPLGADQIREAVFKGVAQKVSFGELTPEEAGAQFMLEAKQALDR